MANDINIDVGARNLASRVFTTVTHDAGRMNRSINRMGSTSVSTFGRMAVSAAGVTTAFTAMAGAGVAAAAAFSVRTFAGFDAEMSKVEAISGATGDGLDTLREKAKALGASTQFSAGEAAEGMKFLGQAGFDTQEILAGIGPTLSLAAAGALDLGMAADIASDVSSAFGLSADEIGRVADVLAVTATSANTNVEMMGETFKLSAPLAKAAGQSLEEMSAAAGLLGNSGIKATVAGTDLKNILSKFSTGSAQEKLRGFGVEALDAQGNIRPMLDVLKELGEKTRDLPGGERLRNFMDIFGERSAKSAVVLADVGGEAIDSIRQKMEDAEGAADRMAKTMMDNLAGDGVKFLSALQGAAIEAAEGMEDELGAAVELATDKVGDLTAFLKDNKSMMKEFGEAGVNSFKAMEPAIDEVIELVIRFTDAVGDSKKEMDSLADISKAIDENVVDFLQTGSAFLGVQFSELFFGDLTPTLGDGGLGQAVELAHQIGTMSIDREKAERDIAASMNAQEDAANSIADSMDEAAEASQEMADNIREFSSAETNELIRFFEKNTGFKGIDALSPDFQDQIERDREDFDRAIESLREGDKRKREPGALRATQGRLLTRGSGLLNKQDVMIRAAEATKVATEKSEAHLARIAELVKPQDPPPPSDKLEVEIV